MSRLLVVILNYLTPDLVIDLLRSLAPEVKALPGTRVVVVDNASDDGSPEQIRAAIEADGWGESTSLLARERNDGYACGNNAAIRQALAGEEPPRYVLLLNSDTIVRSGALRTLLSFMDEHPEAGIAGPGLEDSTGKLQRSLFHFPTLWSQLAIPIFPNACMHGAGAREPYPSDWVSGACMIIRREVFQDIGMLDERFFLYFEDVDFCRRAKQAGWSCWCVPQSRIVHLIAQSTGLPSIRNSARRLPAYWFDARRHYFLKHHGWGYTALADINWLVGYGLWRVRQWVRGRNARPTPRLVCDFLLNSVIVRRLMK